MSLSSSISHTQVLKALSAHIWPKPRPPTVRDMKNVVGVLCFAVVCLRDCAWAIFGHAVLVFPKKSSVIAKVSWKPVS